MVAEVSQRKKREKFKIGKNEIGVIIAISDRSPKACKSQFIQ
jgi:hypothetical protein